VLRCIDTMAGGEIFIPKMPSIKITDLAKAVCPKCRHRVVGIREGEKLHETLVPADDAINTMEYKDKFITHHYVVNRKRKKGKGKVLSSDFKGYKSDNNAQWLSVDYLKKMIADDNQS
jgi:UDP-N-acetylglucosamine 4,6-dehydratase/5-epimerase